MPPPADREDDPGLHERSLETHPRFLLPRLPAHLTQIDLLKGLAILAVVTGHTLSRAQLIDMGARFWNWQAVPIFVVVMGLNAASSYRRHEGARLRALYSRAYFRSRFDRLYVPFLLLLLVSSALALATGALTAKGLVYGLALGKLPFTGPGNYFVTFLFQFVVIFPLIYWLYGRAPRAVIVGSFALAATFDLAAPHVAELAQIPHEWWTEAFFPRFLPYMVFGVMLADAMLNGRRVPRWWWWGGAVSVGYLVAITADPSALHISIGDLGVAGQTFIGAFYPALLVAAGLRWLPSRATGVASRTLARLGVASYEIFLVQILWFGLLGTALGTGESLWLTVPSTIVCCPLGYVLHLGLSRARPIAARRLGRPVALTTEDRRSRLGRVYLVERRRHNVHRNEAAERVAGFSAEEVRRTPLRAEAPARRLR